jgi:MFS transporter, DHA1 family, inner membrane transport protein
VKPLESEHATLLTPRRERRALLVFAAIQFTLVLDFMLLMPLGPALMDQMGLSASTFGALVSCYAISSAVFGFSGGFWLDRVRRSRLLVSLYATFTLATAACALADGPLLLTFARVVAGGAAGLMWASVLACVIDIVPSERRGDAIGLVMTSYALAAVVGVPLGLFTAAKLGWRAPFGLLSASALALGVLLHRTVSGLPGGDAPSATRVRTPDGRGVAATAIASLRELVQPSFVTGWMLSFGVVCAGFLMIPYLGTFLTNNLGVPPTELGWVYLIGGVTTFFTSRLVGRLVDRRGPVICLVGLLLGTLVPHLVLTHLTHATFAQLALTFTAFMTLTSGRMIPTLALITERVPPSLRGRFMAVNTAVTDVASGVASAAGGFLLTTQQGGALSGFGQVGVLACGVSLLTLGVLALHLRARDGERAARSAAETA